jgi:methionyl-tRNA formyltransferase
VARIIFFGNERLATGVTTSAPTLRALIAAGHDVLAVVVNNHTSHSRRVRALEIELAAQEFGLLVLAPIQPLDIYDQLAAMKPDLGVLVAYGKIIPSKLIDLFPYGIINLHPSLLPLHRGSIPIESVLRSGETTTGVSIMQLESRMDAGPIWSQKTESVHANDTKMSLAERLLERGAAMIVDLIPQIMMGKNEPTPQEDEKASIDSQLTKADGRVDPTKSAAVLEQEIRAYLGWPGSALNVANREIIITKAHLETEIKLDPGVIQATKQLLYFGTGTCAISIDRLKPASKREMSAAEFISGVPEFR